MKIGFTSGAFDLFHSGHILMLRECKKVCDFLIVGIHDDPRMDHPEKDKPIQSIVERQIQVNACRYVDETFVYSGDEQFKEMLTALDIDVRIIGMDYKHKDGSAVIGSDICRSRNIEIYYNKRDHNYSSSKLRRRIRA